MGGKHFQQTKFNLIHKSLAVLAVLFLALALVVPRVANGAGNPSTVPVPYSAICGTALPAIGYQCDPITTTTLAPTTTTAAPTTTTTTAPVGVNTISRVLYSMDGPHEGPMADIPSYWSWGTTPEVDNPTPPSGYTAMTAWGQVYADANWANNEPPQGSVRVEFKDMQSWIWSNSQHKWLTCQATTQVDGLHYVDNFANNASIATDWRTEPDGGISSALMVGYNVHFWPTGGRCTFPVASSDIGAVYTTYYARLIGQNVASAHYLANAGHDYWLDTTAGWPNNAQGGEGRFMYLNGSWQSFSFWTGGKYGVGVTNAWTDAQMQANPPPLNPMGQP